MIATRRTIDHLRKLNFLTQRLEEPLENHQAEIPERLLENEQLQLLDKAVQDLLPNERIIIDLFFREGISAKDAAGDPPNVRGCCVYPEKPHPRQAAKLSRTIAFTVRTGC